MKPAPGPTGAVGIAEVKGKSPPSTTSDHAPRRGRQPDAVALRADFQANTDITAGNKPTVQIASTSDSSPRAPKVSGPDVTTQSLDSHRVRRSLVAAHAMYLAVRTADTAL